jgi:hypothetical protein
LLDVANRRIKFSSAGAGRYAGYVHLYGEGLADTTYVLLKASVVTGTTTSLVGQVAAAEGADTASWFYATIPLSFRAETNSVLIIQYWNSDTDAGAEKIAWYADNAALQQLYLLKID